MEIYGSSQDMIIRQEMNMNMNLALMNQMLGLQNLGKNKKIFFFSGNSISLQTRLSSLTPDEIREFTEMNINVTGQKIKAFNMCCYMTTIITGSVILLPFFFLCCDWWKKMVFPAFEVNYNVYESIARIIQTASNLKSVVMTVLDNCFDGAKAEWLYNAIYTSKLNGFSFINMATQVNYNGSEYSNFADNMKPIKTLPKVISDIRWGNQLVL